MNKKYRSIIAVISVFALIIGIIYAKQTKNNDNLTYQQIINRDYEVAQSLEQLKENADIIVKGRYTSFIDTWNMSRDPVDIQKEDSEYYIEGKRYNFQIDEILKGQLQSYAIIVSLDSATKNSIDLRESENDSPNIHEYMYENPLFIEPELGSEYVLFLDYNDEIEGFDYYYGAIEPFSILIKSDKALLQSNLLNTKVRKQKGAKVIDVDGAKVEVKEQLAPLDNFIGEIDYSQLKERLS